MRTLLRKGWRFLKKYGFLILIAFIGFLLLILEDSGYEPFYSLSVFIYFVGIVFGSARWVFNQTKTVIKLKNEQSKTELQHLQSQVNPHFFFNTLNNLYGLIDKNKEQAKDMVLKLSDMMRYSIYDGQKETVTLEQEITYLQNYIDLHKARYHKISEIQFHHHVHNEGQKIMPLLFIILLENAFKHGVENLRENAFVKISLMSSDKEINFAVENNYDPSEVEDKEGIGLTNLKRRLELVYPQNHKLSHSVMGDIYKSQLTISI